MGTDDTPSAGNGIACSAAQNGLRAVISTVSAKESVAVGIVSVDRAVDCINSVMSAALAVLSFVVNLRTLDLNFADAEVSLEVGHIVHGVPEAELYKRSQSQCFFFGAVVGQHETVYFAGICQRNKSGQFSGNSVFGRNKAAVAKAMMALVGIERRLGRLPARVPDGIAVLDVVVASVLIERRIVITVTGQTQKFCVLVEAVSAAGVGNQRKEVLRSKIVDPRKRSLRACDDILFFRIIKMSKLHV